MASWNYMEGFIINPLSGWDIVNYGLLIGEPWPFPPFA